MKRAEAARLLEETDQASRARLLSAARPWAFYCTAVCLKLYLTSASFVFLRVMLH